MIMENILRIIAEILSNIYEFINYGLKFNRSKKLENKWEWDRNNIFSKFISLYYPGKDD